MGQWPAPAKLPPWENALELRQVRQGRPEGLSTKEGGRERIHGGYQWGLASAQPAAFFSVHSLLAQLLAGIRESPDTTSFNLWKHQFESHAD